MGEYSGPCLPHCYRCSHTTVVLSQAAIVIAVALVFIVVFNTIMDARLGSVLSSSQTRFHACLKNHRIACVCAGVLSGLGLLALWRPYTAFNAD